MNHHLANLQIYCAMYENIDVRISNPIHISGE